MWAYIRLTVAIGLLAYGGSCERCDQYSGCRDDCLLCRKSVRTANRAQWRCSEGTLPSAEDADGAEADILHKIGNAIEALRKDGQSPHALRHALQQAVVNKTGHDKHHSRREKQVEAIKQDFMALFQDIAEADSRALHLCGWDPTLDMATEELAGKPTHRHIAPIQQQSHLVDVCAGSQPGLQAACWWLVLPAVI